MYQVDQWRGVACNCINKHHSVFFLVEYTVSLEPGTPPPRIVRGGGVPGSRLIYSTVLFPCSPAPNTRECDFSCEKSEEVADTG